MGLSGGSVMMSDCKCIPLNAETTRCTMRINISDARGSR